MVKRSCGMRGGSFKSMVKGLARRAHQYLKSSKIISKTALAHSHPLANVAGHIAQRFGYGRRHRSRGGALKLAGMGRRMRRMRALPMAY